MKTPFSRTILLLILVAAGGFTGCSTPPETAANTAEDEYITVMVTGSNIPKRVKKSDIANGTVPKDVQAQLVDQDAFSKSLQPGRKVEKGN